MLARFFSNNYHLINKTMIKGSGLFSSLIVITAVLGRRETVDYRLGPNR